MASTAAAPVAAQADHQRNRLKPETRTHSAATARIAVPARTMEVVHASHDPKPVPCSGTDTPRENVPRTNGDTTTMAPAAGTNTQFHFTADLRPGV